MIHPSGGRPATVQAPRLNDGRRQRGEAAGLVGAVHLEAPAAAAELLVQAEVVEHRPEVQQFGIIAELAVAA